jgi:hypothetical protein
MPLRLTPDAHLAVTIEEQTELIFPIYILPRHSVAQSASWIFRGADEPFLSALRVIDEVATILVDIQPA